MTTFDKTTAAVIAGAVVAVVGALTTIDAQVLAAAQTLITAALVWLVPNKAAAS